MTRKPNPNFTLSGRITNRQGQPLQNLIVRACDQDPKSSDDVLGEGVTDQDGRFTIRFSEAQFKLGGKESGGPDVYIVVLAGDKQVGRSEVRRDAGRRISISLQVELPAAEEPSEPAFQVSGVVSQIEGRPLNNLTVHAFDQGLRTQRAPLGEAKTDVNGQYTIGYEQEDLLDPQRGSANLLIEVIYKDGADPVKSEIRYNARRLETINLTLDPDAGKSEWERLQGRLRPALEGVPLEDLNDDELDFIARSYRLQVEALRQARAATLAARKSKLPDWLHFALAQQGLPAEGDALLELPENRILEALEAAQQAKSIPQVGEEEQNNTLELLQQLQADHFLQKPLAGHHLPAKTLFKWAGLPQDAQRQLARALIGREPGLDGTVNLPEESGLTEDQIKAARLTLEMARLSDDHAGVVKALRQDSRIQSLRDLAHHYDPQDWEEMVKAVAAKDNSDLPDDLRAAENGRAAYARRLYASAAAAYPTVAVAYGLSRRERVKKESPAVALLPRIVEADAAFDLGSTRLSPYINERREAFNLTEESANAAIDTLKGVQRLYRLRPEMPFIARLLEEPIKDNGKKRTLDSAMAIVHVGRSRFVEQYGADDALERETAVAVYNAAEKITARALGIYSHFNPAINTTPLPAAIDCPVPLKDVPDWPTLFGSLDGCACEPCESVYSPAAYLTDLLAFIERQVERLPDADPAVILPENGLQALAERSFCDKDDQLVKALAPRRPDVAGTLLSCRNAETEMPYVDLVLEIMENAVAPRNDSGTLQTGLPADQLAAQAEHFNENAYQELAKTIFPLSMPFDLWHEEETIYLEKLGTSRAELLETLFPFQATGAPDQDPHDLTEIRRWQNQEIAKARLCLTDKQLEIIANTAQTNVAVAPAWGYNNATNWWHPLRNNADVFLTRSGLRYEDMLRLFTLRSFNPTGSIGIDNNSLGECDPKKIQLKGLNVAALGFLHRFLRLQRVLGWSLRQLDQALLALSLPSSSNNRPALDDTFLVRLSHVIHLQERFGLPLDELLSWWSPLDTNDYQVKQLPQEKVMPSLYARLFLNGRAGESEYEAFRLNEEGSELATPNEPLKNQLPFIAGAIRVPLADMEGLVNSLFTQLLFRGIWPEFDDSIATLDPTGDSAVPTAFVTWLSEQQITLTPNARIEKQLERVWKVTDGDIEYEFRKTATVLHVTKRTSPSLNLANVSLVFRHASLVRALRLKIEDYLTLKALIGFDPFSPAQLSGGVSIDGTLQTLRFVERAMAAESGFSITELDYLLLQTMPFEGKTVAPTEAWARQSLNTLKAAVEAVSVSAPAVRLISEMLILLDADPPSAVRLDELRRLLATAISAFPESNNNEDQRYRTMRQHLREVESLLAAEQFDINKRDTARAKINEVFEFYAQTLQELQTNTLASSLAEILALPVPVCKALLEHTPLPADEEQTAVAALLAAFIQQEDQDEPGAAANSDNQPVDSATGATGDSDENNNWAEPEASQEAEQEPLVALIYRLHKAALVIDRLGIQAYELIDKDVELHQEEQAESDAASDGNGAEGALPKALPRYLSMHETAGWLKILGLPVRDTDTAGPYDAWMRTVRLFHFRDALLPEQQEHCFGLFDIAAEYAPGDTPFATEERRRYYVELATFSGWAEDDLRALVGQFDIGQTSSGGILKAVFPRHFADERLPSRILNAIQLFERLGASASAVEGWYITPPGPVIPGAQAARIKNALKSRYGDGWPEALKPLRDPLRERQRQALVRYLLHEWNLERAEELFDHFLIDVEMSPCMMTSRLIQATAAVQLFVQRVVMNLEPVLYLSAEGAEQWEWMKNYRIWEANRKVFLYPENWIEPELRDDKTPFFKDLENELLQADINNETAETALLHYIEKLHEVARLQICGQYLETNPAVLHVFGRTRDVPHHYYYRRGILELEHTDRLALSEAFSRAHWTPWERVNVEIEGDHLIPVVYNRRVYLFWPLFTEKDELAFSQLEKQIIDFFRFAYQFQLAITELQSEVASLVLSVGQAIMSGTVSAVEDGLNGLVAGLNSLRTQLSEFNQRFNDVQTTLGTSIQGATGSTIDHLSGPLGLNFLYDAIEDLIVSVENNRNITFSTPVTLFNTTILPVNITPNIPPNIPPANPAIQIGRIEGIINNLTELIDTHLTGQFLDLFPAKRLEVQLAWSEYKHDSWAAKKTSAGIISFRDVITPLLEFTPSIPGTGQPTARRLFTFRSEIYNGSLTIRCQLALPGSIQQCSYKPKDIGLFRLNGCNGRLDATDLILDQSLKDTLFDFLSELGIRLTEQVGAAIATVHGIPAFQQGEPRTIDDDPFRPSWLRCFLEGILPKHYIWHQSLLTNEEVMIEDIYRILSRYHRSPNDFWADFEGFFYQDASRAFLCYPWMLPNNNPGKPAKPWGFLFFPFYHPYTCALLENLHRFGIPGIYNVRFHQASKGSYQQDAAGKPLQIELKNDEFFRSPEYDPTDNVYNPPNGPPSIRPVEEYDFSTIGAYAQYNWEIFFHIPLLIASRLSTNQKFREAQHWFHYIFNPTDASHGESPAKYWRTKPFVERSKAEYTVQDIDQLLLLLNGEAEIPGLQEIEQAVRRWRRDAFNPHLIARTRSVAFQKTVVMKYIDNLIAWADSLFRRETREAVNEAMQLYILAAKLLGPRPRRIQPSAVRTEKSFNELKEGLDSFSNALVELENHLAGNTSAPGTGIFGSEKLVMALEDKGKLAGATLAPVDNAVYDLVVSPSIRDIIRQPGESSLYFCVPPNDKLLDKWEIVADRLFKIRHCQNIEGQTLTLSLLSPPIDPALLVRAKALGIDIDTVLSQLHSPLPHYRFQTLAQKATELCGEVRSLGGALLSALEKQDGEQLALLRNTHELRVLEAVTAIKDQQIKEATCSLEGLKHSQEASTIRRDHHLRLLMEFLNPEEMAALTLNANSLILQIVQFGVTWGASAASLIPNIKVGFVTTLGGTSGGDNIKGAAENAAQAMGVLSSILGSTSGLISSMGSYRRRAEDWLLQIVLAGKELEGLEKQICAAEIRLAVAESDLENHKLQIRNNRDTQEFMQQKFTNQALCDWMVAQTASLYFQSYQLAYDMARKAQQAYTFELGEDDPGIIRYGYWDSLKKGLLAGEHLHHDLKRLEVDYLDKNRREYELTKNISLSALDPLELIKLRETGEAEFSLPEALFDMDFPGHYMRRIKSVSLSIPCVTGPYSGVYATLRLEKSRIRCKPDVNANYLPINNDDDLRFQTQHSATRVMATSTGQYDSGLFELSFRDERYLPFEGEGVESRWSLSINKEFAQFDLDTISDVILHVRYTARDDGEALKGAALESLRDIQDALTTIDNKPLPLTRLFSIRHEFPDEWARFQAQTPADGQTFELTLDLRKEHYPFWSQGRLNSVLGIDILARSTASGIEVSGKTLAVDPSYAELHVGELEQPAQLLNKPVGELKLLFNTAAMSDLWIAMKWSSAFPA